MGKGLFVNNWLISCICLVFGILLLIWPITVLVTSSKILAILLIIGSCINIFQCVFSKYEKTNTDIYYLLISLLVIGIAVSMLANPIWVIASINIFIGLILIINNIGAISSILTIKEETQIWWAYIIVPVLMLIAGFIIIFNPIIFANVMTRIEGISLIINTISTMVIMYKLKI